MARAPARWPLVLAIVPVLLAGCTIGEDDASTATTPDATTTPASTPTTTPEPTTTTPANTTTTTPPPTPDPSPEPEPDPPVVNVSHRHDYSKNTAANHSFLVPEGARNLTMSVQFDAAPSGAPGTYACAGKIRIVVVRPDGSLQDDTTASPATGTSPDLHCGAVRTGSFPKDFPPGTWHVGFEGSGVGYGIFSLRSS